MKCPFCGRDTTRVVDSRPVDDNAAIRRRRLCDSCGRRFTSFEKVELLPVMVIKKDQSRVPFDRNKIESCVLRACHKRPVSMDQVRALVDAVENEVTGSGEREIRSSEIGESVMRHLKALAHYMLQPDIFPQPVSGCQKLSVVSRFHIHAPV